MAFSFFESSGPIPEMTVRSSGFAGLVDFDGALPTLAALVDFVGLFAMINL